MEESYHSRITTFQTMLHPDADQMQVVLFAFTITQRGDCFFLAFDTKLCGRFLLLLYEMA